MKNKLGYWYEDYLGLPYFDYVGNIPYKHILNNGTKVKLPEDPWFILGNYQMTVFPHVSGGYELITGQRTWGRLNIGDTPNSGNNKSTIHYKRDNKKIATLVGMDSLSADTGVCKRLFGCGFAEYQYYFDNLEIIKNLSVKPSTNPYNGSPAFMLTIQMKNYGEKVEIQYQEELTAKYAQIQYQYVEEEKREVQYEYETCKEDDYAIVNIRKIDTDPLLIENRNTQSRYEGFPPALFMKTLSRGTVKTKGQTMMVEHSLSLEKNETKTIQILIGFTFEEGVNSLENIMKDMIVEKNFKKGQSLYGEEWRKVIPLFDKEDDEVFRREMQWNTYVIEAMATYSEYYKETKIPQGTIYDYDWGQHLSARDNFQHAMPLVYYNKELSRSVLRYMLKRTTPYGEIRLAEYGYGYCDNLYYFTSDQQLFFFQYLEAYLRETKDYKILLEDITPYPATCCKHTMKVYELVKNCFIFLRDSVGFGEHGLVKLLNSDWNDTLFYIVKEPYNRVYNSGESHMNSAMALSILQNLIPQLKKANSIFEDKSIINNLCESMSLYRDKVLKGFTKELEDRAFSKRMYFAGKVYGEDNMFLEPQGFMMQVKEYSLEQKQVLYSEMKKRVYNGEKIGAREQEKPEFEDWEYDKGSRENGGFWWALNAPVIIAMKDIDKTEAWNLLRNLTFENISSHFPEYWSSYWSQADNIESSLIPEEGLSDQSANYSNIPVFCAHAHSWPLYCYYYLKE